MSEYDFAPLRLKKNEDKRLRAGHLWVFSNEIDTKATPLTTFEPGQPVVVEDLHGKPVGTGYVNPHSLICARLVGRDKRYPFSSSLLVHRLKVALSLREKLFDKPFYRWVFGEGDGLPGLVVDRYDDVLVVQLTTAGMEVIKQDIIAALQKVAAPAAILLRNDSSVRKLEGLELYTETAFGEVPEYVDVIEHGLNFRVPLATGQKTGWFYDQHDNRASLRRFVEGKRVLDVFSYAGAWGLQAAAAGATEVICVDESERAHGLIQHNASQNGLVDKVQAVQQEAFVALKALQEKGERFDVIVLDPPAFIKRKKDFKQGTQAYRRINELAMRLLEKDAVLVSCSCSHHMPQQELMRQMQQAARHVDRFMQILLVGGQAPDHPVHPAIPETAYLKAIFARLTH